MGIELSGLWRPDALEIARNTRLVAHRMRRRHADSHGGCADSVHERIAHHAAGILVSRDRHCGITSIKGKLDQAALNIAD